jgi:hypothetical protein
LFAQTYNILVEGMLEELADAAVKQPEDPESVL